MDMDDLKHTLSDGLPMNRRSALKCVATWAGTGVVWALVGGVPRAFAANAAGAGAFSFIQISDSHVGFNKAANPEPLETLQLAIDRVVALPEKPSLILHILLLELPARNISKGGISRQTIPEEISR